MKQPASKTECSFREKGSKFIGFLLPVDSKTVFETELDQLKNTYPDATHHCYAWRLNAAQVQEFAQDDGEPSGTAGLPILNQLKSYEVINAAIVVVRYYGGTNLGKSGLIEAYGGAARKCLQRAQLTPIELIWKVKINYPYAEQNTIEQLMHQFELSEINSKYAEAVTLLLGCPVQHKEALQTRLEQLSHRNIESTMLEKSYR